MQKPIPLSTTLPQQEAWRHHHSTPSKVSKTAGYYCVENEEFDCGSTRQPVTRGARHQQYIARNHQYQSVRGGANHAKQPVLFQHGSHVYDSDLYCQKNPFPCGRKPSLDHSFSYVGKMRLLLLCRKL